MPTKPQIQLIQIAKSQLVKAGKLTDQAYRVLLQNVAGVDSSKRLDNKSIERVMAIFEQMGFVDSVHGAGYWQGKAGRQLNEYISDRQVRALESMAAQTRYPLASLIRRLTNHRTDKVDQIDEDEAYKVHEALKDILEREREAAIEPPAGGVESNERELTAEEMEGIPF